MYSRENKDPQKETIEQTLSDFYKSNNYIGGIDILRWTKNGLIELKQEVLSQQFIEWYPRDQSYLILRFAKMGLLKYKDQP